MTLHTSRQRAAKGLRVSGLAWLSLALSFACSGDPDPSTETLPGADGASAGAGNGAAGATQAAGTSAAPSQSVAGAASAGASAMTPGTSGAAPVDPTADRNTEPTVAPDQVVTETDQAVDCASLVRPPTPLRRLTRFEYDSTVRDLFQTDLRPARDFPQDEVADGFSNNALVLTVSGLHAEGYVAASEALAAEAVSNMAAILPCDPAAVGEQECALSFAETFGRRAFRRELQPADLESLMAAYAVGDSFEKGIEVMIRAILQSPNFLYRIEFTGADTPGRGMVRTSGYETATRLSYLLWGSAPDDALLEAAESGALDAPEQVAEVARRLLLDERARPAVSEFYRQWLELTALGGKDKDGTAFPEWNDDLRSAMLEEGEAFVSEILWGRGATLPELLTAPLGLARGPLAELYGVAETDGVVELPATERSGVLTLPGFLASHGHPDQTSPVLRGKFIRTKLFCTSVPPPPDMAMISPPDPTEGGTARERFSEHSKSPECAGCHALMDPLGFPLESYDAIGRFRTTDGGQALDLTGEFLSTRDLSGPFDGVVEMAQQMSTSEQVRDCVASQWFKYAMGRGVQEGDACSVSPLQDAFAASGANLMELMVSMTQTEAFLYRRSASEEVTQ